MLLAGEKFWRMPLEDSYADQLKSPIADMKNTGSRWVHLVAFVKLFQILWQESQCPSVKWDPEPSCQACLSVHIFALHH